MENPVDVLNPGRIYRVSDLLVWKHLVGGTRLGFGPELTCFPNPVIQDDLVLASLFSPGHIYALDKATGEGRWHCRLAHLGDTPISSAGFFFVGDSKSLLSLSPNTGKTLWEFTPYEGDGGAFCSLPIYVNGTVFIGDREGMFYCLSAETGKKLWSVETSRAQNASVNATALAFENLIIIATNAKLAIAYEQTTGQEVWRQRLPERSIYQVQMYEDMALIRTKKALVGLSLRTGEIIQKWQWRGMKIRSVAVAGSMLCMVVSNEPGRNEKIPANPHTELLGIHLDRVKWRLQYPLSSIINLRWDPETRLLYEAMSAGLGIVDPETGTRKALLTGFTTVLQRDTGWPDDEVGLPSIENGRLYILHTSGTVWALQHPTD